MIDMRETINLRVIALLNQVPGIQGVFRDRGQLPPVDKTPGILYLDGTEKILTKLEGNNLTQMPAAVFTMYPQIFLVLTKRDNMTNETLNSEDNPVGPELSAFRIKIINAILQDDTLAALCTDNGSVFYVGHDTDMQTGKEMGTLGAMMQFHFEISYVLDPSDLS